MNIDSSTTISHILAKVEEVPSHKRCSVYEAALQALDNLASDHNTSSVDDLKRKVADLYEKEKKILVDEFMIVIDELEIQPTFDEDDILEGTLNLGYLFQVNELNEEYEKDVLIAASKLVFLRTLNLDKNGLTSLPECLGDLINLEELDISSNRLDSLPASIGNLAKLKQVDFSGNPLSSLPSYFEEFASVDGREINLSNTLLPIDVLNSLSENVTRDIDEFSDDEIDNGSFINLENAIDFWGKLSSRDSEETKFSLTLDAPKSRMIKTFLKRLTTTADYKSESTRQLLADRVLDFLQLLSEDESIRDPAIEVIEHGMNSCEDRIAITMDELELIVRVKRANSEQDSTA